MGGRQRLGAEADAEHGNTGGFGASEEVELVVRSTAGVGFVHRTDRAHRDDDVVVGRLAGKATSQRVAVLVAQHDVGQLETLLTEALADEGRIVPGFRLDDQARTPGSYRARVSAERSAGPPARTSAARARPMTAPPTTSDG